MLCRTTSLRCAMIIRSMVIKMRMAMMLMRFVVSMSALRSMIVCDVSACMRMLKR